MSKHYFWYNLDMEDSWNLRAKKAFLNCWERNQVAFIDVLVNDCEQEVDIALELADLVSEMFDIAIQGHPLFRDKLKKFVSTEDMDILLEVLDEDPHIEEEIYKWTTDYSYRAFLLGL